MFRSASSFRLYVGRGGGWIAVAAAAAALVIAPVVALIVAASSGAPGAAVETWSHLAAYVLPQAAVNTVVLLLGVGAITIVVGTGTAWLVTAYDFPGRKLLDWALLLPLAVPTYIVAYAYLDILHPIGPFQTGLRALFGIDGPQGLRLPDVRSMGGCILLLGFVLYPYVYLTARSLFLMQAASLIEAARTLGETGAGIFFRVALPLCRPAIAVGTALALMETLNDIGASELLGVRTMTVAIYTTWIARSDLAGAAQLALCMLGLVITLVVLERFYRRHLSYANAAQRPRRMIPRRLAKAAGWAALGIAVVPLVVGFVIPAAYLAVVAMERFNPASFPQLMAAAAKTVVTSAVATFITIVLGVAIAYTLRLTPGRGSRTLFRISSLGYAIPGTVLALGLLGPLAMIDRFIHLTMDGLFAITTGLIFLGSGAAVIIAYVVRFVAVPAGAIDAGFSRLSPSFDHAARSLGTSATGALVRVHLPLLRPTLAAAAVLVFVDCMKELPATLLLRPLNFETLPTLLYGEAARGTYENGAAAAFLIIASGILPAILLARQSGGTPEHSKRGASAAVSASPPPA